MITKNKYGIENFKVEGHRGTWYAIAGAVCRKPDGETVELFVLEHERYGGQAAWIITDREGRIYCEDAWNSWEDLHYETEIYVVKLIK